MVLIGCCHGMSQAPGGKHGAARPSLCLWVTQRVPADTSGLILLVLAAANPSFPHQEQRRGLVRSHDTKRSRWRDQVRFWGTRSTSNSCKALGGVMDTVVLPMENSASMQRGTSVFWGRDARPMSTAGCCGNSHWWHSRVEVSLPPILHW